jgi:hypothetical protein
MPAPVRAAASTAKRRRMVVGTPLVAISVVSVVSVPVR